VGAFLAVAADGVEREVDAEGDHGDRHDQRQDEVVLQADQVADALEPDDQHQERRAHGGEHPVAAEGHADHHQHRQDREADERPGDGALFLAGEVDVDGDAVDLQALGAAQDLLDLAVVLLGLGVTAEVDRGGAEPEDRVVGEHDRCDRRHDPVAVRGLRRLMSTGSAPRIAGRGVR
jgi:hypothetical protein